MEERKKVIKPSIKFAWVLVVFAIGIAVSEIVQPSLWLTGSLLLSAGVFLFFVYRHPNLRFAAILFIAFFLGSIRFVLAEPFTSGKNLISYHNSNIEIQGIIINTKEDFNRSRIIVDSKNPGRGRLYAIIKDEQFSLGEQVKLNCILKKPEQGSSDFNFPGWLASKNVFTVCDKAKLVDKTPPAKWYWRAVIARTRTQLINRVNSSVREPAASLAIAFLIGEEKNLPPKMVSDFQTAGLSHIIAVSGYQVTLFTTILIWILVALTISRRLRVAVIVIFLFFFVFLAAAQAGVIRAAIMAGLFAFAAEFGRKGHIRNALLTTGAIMVFINPFILLHDVSFQLSFAATWGLVDLEPRIKALAPRFFSLLGEGSSTLAAIIAVTPIAVFHFGRFALYAPIANILALPIVAIFTILSVPLVILALFAGPIAGFLGQIMNVMAEALAIIAGTAARLPYAELPVPVWAGIALLAAVLIFLPRSRDLPKPSPSVSLFL